MDSNVSESSVEQLFRELKELRQVNFNKKTELEILRKQIDDTVKQRDALNSEVKRISTDVRPLRDRRDSFNAQVKELKKKRDELRTAAAQKRETLSKLLQQTREISEQLHGSMSAVLKEIQSLEWFIQTNPLAPQTERSLVAKIGKLEANLAKHKGLRNIRDKLLLLKVEIAALRMQAQATHEELTKIAKESEKVHTAMQEHVKILTGKKKEADEKHSEYLEQSKRRLDGITVLRQNADRMVEIRARVGEVKTSSRVEKAEKLRSKYKEAANQKLRSGGKLSFEEFQALMADSLSDADED